ncbi:MAG TPA: OsmC family protein [Trueperaceae bacterium]|nr:OsmC family protein [Trueperaceae bacterium]
MPTRRASARWEGTLREGSGTMSFGSGAFEGRYSFSSRFEEGTGTNPEELIAAAHAGCFSMALSGNLSRAGHPPAAITTEAKVTIERQEAGFRITKSHLTCEATVPGISEDEFREQATAAKAGCPVSAALAGVEITLDARLVG